MKCPVCGNDNKYEGKYCAKCGSLLEGDDGTTSDGSGSGTTSDSGGGDGGTYDSLIGKYELKNELGRGAMARVWRAYDPALDRYVAIKVPLFDSNLSQDVIDELGRRFVDEARIAGRLNHPNIVTTYAADIFDGTPAIVMELIEGQTLADMLERGALDPEYARALLNELLDAVGHAHAHGIIHRDIKPENIFVNQAGHVKLADFGIAHIDSSTRTHQTMAGTVLGTPGYMSPEQARGVQAVDERSDLFSIGVVGYEMLVGYNPFGVGESSNSTTMLYRIVHEPVQDPGTIVGESLPESMRQAILKALEKDPAMRPQSAAEFKTMLNGGMEVVAPPPPPPSGPPKWLPYVIIGAVGVAALVAVFIAATSGQRGVAPPSNGGSSAIGVIQTPPGQEANGDAQKADEEAKQKAEAEAKQKAEAEAKQKAEAEAAKQKGQSPPSFTSATASSELEPSEGYTFGPTNALDDSFDYAWDEGVDGDGIGEWIMLSANSNQLVSGVKIINGAGVSTKNFYNNNRAKVLLVEFSDGESQEITLSDNYDTQTINFAKQHTTTYMKFTIRSVYRGNNYDDTSLTMIKAF